jgi:hypothetical protein
MISVWKYGEGDELYLDSYSSIVLIHYQGTFLTFFSRECTFSRIFEASIEKITKKDIKILCKTQRKKKGKSRMIVRIE